MDAMSDPSLTADDALITEYGEYVDSVYDDGHGERLMTLYEFAEAKRKRAAKAAAEAAYDGPEEPDITW